MFGYLSNAGYIISSETFIQLVFNLNLSRCHAGNKIVIIIVAAVASLVTLITIICALFLWRRMKQKVESKSIHF
jgi:hypothetical protein